MENLVAIDFNDAICFAIVSHCANGNSKAAKRLASLFVSLDIADSRVIPHLESGDYSRAYDVASWLRANPAVK